MNDSLKKRYSVKLFANIVSALMNAIVVALVPKALGPAAYGQFVYLQEFFMKSINFLDMGSSIAFFTKLSARHDRKELITFYFIYSFIVLALMFGFIYVSTVLDVTNIFIPNIPIKYIFMGLFFGFFTWFTQLFIKISDAYALTVSVEVIKIGYKAVSLLFLLFLLYQFSFDLELFYYFHYISLFSFLILISWLFVKKDIFSNIFNLRFSFSNLLKEFIEYCHPLVVYSVIGVFSGLFDIWLLQKIAGSEQMGFYGLAYSLAAMCFLFTSAMTPIITREFAKSYEQKNLELMQKLFSRYIPMLYSISAFFAVFISIQSENVLMIFADEKYKDAFFVLMVMAIYPVHQTYGQLSGSIFYATGQTKLMRNIALFTQPIGIFVAFVFIYLLDLGAVGLAYKMVLIQFIGVNIQLYFNTKLLKLEIKYFLWHQIYAVVFFAIFAIIPTFFISFDSVLIEFLISGFIYTLFVTIGTYIFPQIFATSREEIKLNFSRLKNVIKK